MRFERFNKHLHPQGGKFFIDEDGIKHKAEQWEFLVNRLIQYRERAGKSPGNPKEEIEAQVCARQPGYCQSTSGTPAQPRLPRKIIDNPRTMTHKILRWLAAVLNLRRAGKARKVAREEASRRAEICARCPQQRKLSAVCGACNTTRKSAASVLLGNEKRVNVELGGCRILHEDTSISVHLELEPGNNTELPAECWRKS